MRYLAVIERGGSSWGAQVPDLPGCVAVGETRDEVLGLIREAIAPHIEGRKEDGLAVFDGEAVFLFNDDGGKNLSVVGGQVDGAVPDALVEVKCPFEGTRKCRAGTGTFIRLAFGQVGAEAQEDEPDAHKMCAISRESSQ